MATKRKGIKTFYKVLTKGGTTLFVSDSKAKAEAVRSRPKNLGTELLKVTIYPIDRS